MFHGCRPAGRLFYWLLAATVMVASSARIASAADSPAKPGKATNSSAAKRLGTESSLVSPEPQSSPTLTNVVEVRQNDYGWGQANDRNLLGRFSTQTFSLPRLARTQDYFLRLYDSSLPPRYSRYSAALHVDYPL